MLTNNNNKTSSSPFFFHIRLTPLHSCTPTRWLHWTTSLKRLYLPKTHHVPAGCWRGPSSVLAPLPGTPLTAHTHHLQSSRIVNLAPNLPLSLKSCLLFTHSISSMLIPVGVTFSEKSSIDRFRPERVRFYFFLRIPTATQIILVPITFVTAETNYLREQRKKGLLWLKVWEHKSYQGRKGTMASMVAGTCATACSHLRN